MDQAIEELAQACVKCATIKSAPAVAPMHLWVWPDTPWQRIHVDFAGPFQNKMFLIVVDAHLKWPEVVEVMSTTAERTVEVLQSIFAAHGLPEQLASNNGPRFTSEVFQEFVQQNGVRHIRCSPYQPSSNGLVERFVRTFKEAMKSVAVDGRSTQQKLASFLLSYRSTPHATTNESPSMLFLRQQVRTKFDLLRPDMKKQVATKQSQQKTHHDAHAKLRELAVGDTVVCRDFQGTSKWQRGTILQKLGPLTYMIVLSNGKQLKHHIDHIKPLQPSFESDDDSLVHGSTTPTTSHSGTTVTERHYPSRICCPIIRYGQLTHCLYVCYLLCMLCCELCS